MSHKIDPNTYKLAYNVHVLNWFKLRAIKTRRLILFNLINGCIYRSYAFQMINFSVHLYKCHCKALYTRLFCS